MNLFVGNISRNISESDLKKEFGRFGECNVEKRGSYGFIEYTKEGDAEEAKRKLQGYNLGGLRLNVEWSKKSGKFDKDSSKRNDSRGGGGRRRSRSRSDSRGRRNRRRSNSRDRRSGSRSNNRGHNRGKSRSRSRSREERGTPTYSPMHYSDNE